MRALRVDAPNEARLVEIEAPPPGPGEVLVRVAAAGICGSDVELLHGQRPAPFVRYPIVPGHEWAGTIEELGAGVDGLAVGDRVVAEGFRSCGRCDRCREGRTNLCAADYAETGFTHQGAFAERLSVPARLIHRLPASADLAAAALLEPAACVAQGLLEVDLRPGLMAAVVGGGTLGQIATALLRLASPARLALVDRHPERQALARRMGATEAVAPDEAGALAGQFDLVFEATGRALGPALAVGLARRGGTVVLEGISGAAEPTLVADEFALKHLRAQGIFGASSAAWRWATALFASGQLELAPLISHRFPLAEHERAFDTVASRARGALKVQLVPA